MTSAKSSEIHLILFLAILHFLPQEILMQFSVIKPDVKHLNQPNPAIARVLSQNCSIDDYTTVHNVRLWWDGFFSSELSTPGQKPLNDYLKTNPSRVKLDEICFFEDEHYGFLYECSVVRSFSMCTCMKSPVVTQPWLLNDAVQLFSCLVDQNQICVAEQRDKLPEGALATSASMKYRLYPCIPYYYCNRETKTCTACPKTYQKNLAEFCPNLNGAAARLRFPGIPWNEPRLSALLYTSLIYVGKHLISV